MTKMSLKMYVCNKKKTAGTIINIPYIYYKQKFGRTCQTMRN